MLEEQKLKAEQLYIKYWPLMCHVAMEILQNSADAEDVVQQAFLYLMLHMDKLGDIDSPSTKAYVSLTAKHRAIDLYRSRRRYEPADVSGMRTSAGSSRAARCSRGYLPTPVTEQGYAAAPLLGGLYHRRNRRNAPHEERRRTESHLEGKKEALRKIGGELTRKKRNFLHNNGGNYFMEAVILNDPQAKGGKPAFAATLL